MLKNKGLIALFAGIACCFSGHVKSDELPQSKQSPASDEIDINKISEAFGNFIGRNLQSPGVHFDLESVIKGIRNGAAGKPAPMSDQDYELAMTRLQEKAYETMAKENLDAANNFMTKNAQEKGVSEIVPGKLQYTILEQGNGEVVQNHGRPLIHYTGKYLDGTVFGASEEVGGPITIPLDQTIPGFSKGLLGMKEGEKRRLFIHPDLGYGTLGNLPPNAMLIFDIEVIKAEANDHDELAENDMQSEEYMDDDEYDGPIFDEEEMGEDMDDSCKG